MSTITLAQAVQMAAGHLQAGRLADAGALCRQILAVDSRQADALHLLGLIAYKQNRHPEAADHLSLSLASDPGNPRAAHNLGLARQALGQWEQARACHEQAIRLDPGFADAHSHLGIVLQRLCRLDEARACFERVVALQPASPEACNNLGTVLLDAERPDEARLWFERALSLRPGFPEAETNLGNALLNLHRLDEARACFERALARRPDLAQAHNGLGFVFKDLGRIDDSLASVRRALALRPDDAALGSNLIHGLHLDPAADAAALRDAAERWNARHAEPLRATRRPHANDPDPGRRLKVGYVSADLREHAVSHFVAPLFAAHDHTRFEIHAYASVARPDAVTARLRGFADVWHDVAAFSDEALADGVRADGIDILVDLSLHTAGHRLLAFAREPAPVQVSWLGYPGSTGTTGIGYRLTDARLEPPDTEAGWSSEEPVRLPGCWCCYEPPGDAPPVGALPASGNGGAVTFGCLNYFSKINEPTLRLWSRVLAAVPGARLCLRCPPGEARARVRDALRESGGRKPAALEFVWREPTRQDYLRHYHKIDIALDPVPYNGMTTSCEALWMGVPMVTRPGELPASRAGLSLLTSLGLETLAAGSDEEFVRVAAGLAGDLPRLAELRVGMRERMRRSELLDAPRFARNVETAYRDLWRRWCASRPDGAPA